MIRRGALHHMAPAQRPRLDTSDLEHAAVYLVSGILA